MFYKTMVGEPSPLGVFYYQNGVNFSVFSARASQVFLCLFDLTDDFREVRIKMNCSENVWHILVFDIPKTYLYSYRVEIEGMLIDGLFSDPYGHLIYSSSNWGEDSTNEDLKCYVYPQREFDWENVQSPKIPISELIIYELHVRGFTQDDSSKSSNKGTFLGLIEKIPYLKSLGINAVQLLPVHFFNELETYSNYLKKDNQKNYWGYSTVNFFSPMTKYAVEHDKAIIEFKSMVKALHENGIEVILDVVFNHTADINFGKKKYSFEELEKSDYYILTKDKKHTNYSGCGNTISANKLIPMYLILTSLRYWVSEMRVDGFRFDLASIFSRNADGSISQNPEIIEMLVKDDILSDVKFIAEPWDAAGLYQVGSFPGGGRFSEWNGKYRDSLRNFIKGSNGYSADFATRISGSSDLYYNFYPQKSINFITCHDGFSLRDLVSYNSKHNENNLENNKDGDNNNNSWNCGIEGVTEDSTINKFRIKQHKNFIIALLMSLGIPMLAMGDEYGHTAYGNNNTWCQDNELNWFQWKTQELQADFFEFYKRIISFRKEHKIFSKTEFYNRKDITWLQSEGSLHKWEYNSRFVGCLIFDYEKGYVIYYAVNSYHYDLNIEIPKQYEWNLIFDSEQTEEEYSQKETLINSYSYKVTPYTSIVLKAVLK